MRISEELKSKSMEELESWVFEALEGEKIPAEELVGVLDYVGRKRAPNAVEEWTGLVLDAFAERELSDAGLELLRLRAEWRKDSPELRKSTRTALRKVFPSRVHKTFMECIGFEEGVSASEALRRMTTLLGLKEGVLCHDKTWGFGIVKRLDDFYKKATIDFAKKRGHQMSFAYAAETLDLIGDDHLLARKHREPEALAALVQDDPAEVVRITLHSYGPLNAALLKEALVPEIMPEADWKSFWDGARRGLKNDPLVDLPAKRSEPIRLLASEKAYDERWFNALGNERDFTRIFELAEELIEARELGTLEEDSNRDTLAGRLWFVVLGTESKLPDLAARALLLAQRTGVLQTDHGWTGATARLLKPKTFLQTLADLPARELTPCFHFFLAHDAATTTELMLTHLGDFTLSTLNAAVPFLREQGHVAELEGRLTELLAADEPTPQVVYWACRNLDLVRDGELIAIQDLPQRAVQVMEGSYSADALKAYNQLRSLLEQRDDWFQQVLPQLTSEQRAGLLERVNASRGWDASSRRSVLAKIVKLYPDLKDVLTRRTEPEEETPQGRFTSMRSHREKRMQLEKLVNEEIPENSREIGVARSYGDLRENAEYKYAKEHQTVLMRRKAELEHDLVEVRATDFANFPADVVGMGVAVVLSGEDGARRTIHVLGEWDRDEEMGIVSCRSKLAEALMGHKTGDRVEIPTGGGMTMTPCTIEAIRLPPDEIKQWIQG